ncbi:MAG TPA: hypothetical protein DHW82_03115 [Spirochaetia bacterium]|nr:MAG: hypothetical protein A2Y41_04015 [Spirochaetes bacterium GWB1_36_13]HCL55982.1 hypothetical protein [Spirochaetia bacterium]
MKRQIFLAVFFSVLAVTAFAKKGGMNGYEMGGGHMEMRFERILEEAGVSSDVRIKIQGILLEMKKEVMDMQYQIYQKRTSMREEMMKDQIDEGKIKKLIEEIAEIRKNEQIKVEMKKLETIKLLTPEQRKKVFEFFAKNEPKGMKEKDMKGKGKGYGPGGKGGPYSMMMDDVDI